MPRIPTLLPPDPSLFNYQVASANLPIVRFYLNSLFVVGRTTVGYLFFCSLAGYAFAKGRFPGKTFFFIAFLATLFIPFETRMIPLYLFMSDLGLNNTLVALVLPFLVGGFGTFLMRQTISTHPGRPDRGGAARRRERVPHLLADRHAALQAGARGARHHQHHLALERRALAAARHLEPRHVHRDAGARGRRPSGPASTPASRSRPR